MKNLRTKIGKFETIQAEDQNGLHLQDDGGNGLFIKDGGHVGIGTANPANKLHITADNNDEYDESSYALAALQIQNTNTTASSPHSLIHFRLDKNGADGYLGFITDGSTPNTQQFVLGNQGTGECLRVKSNGNVGIGIGNPTKKLSIFDQIDGSPVEDQNYGEIGFGSRSDGTTPVVIKGLAGDNLNGTDGKLQFLTTNNTVDLAPTPRMTIDEVGNVGIGTTSPLSSEKLVVYRPTNVLADPVQRWNSDVGNTANTIGILFADGDLELEGVVTESTSDIRLKENIIDATPKLDDLMKLEVKNFNLIDDNTKKKRIGFIAQEMEKVFPSLVKTFDSRKYDEDGNVISGYEDAKTVRVKMDFAILTKAIQEQQQIIEDLKSRIETLEQ